VAWLHFGGQLKMKWSGLDVAVTPNPRQGHQLAPQLRHWKETEDEGKGNQLVTASGVAALKQIVALLNCNGLLGCGSNSNTCIGHQVASATPLMMEMELMLLSQSGNNF